MLLNGAALIQLFCAVYCSVIVIVLVDSVAANMPNAGLLLQAPSQRANTA